MPAHPPLTTPSSPQTSDQERIVIPLATDERCWFKCRQSNAGRLRGQDPMCSMFCYYSNGLPTLIKDPTGRSRGAASGPSTGAAARPRADADDDEARQALVDRYTFRSLQGKYVYVAAGRPAVARHLASMHQLGALEHLWLVQRLSLDRPPLHPPPPEKSLRGVMVLAYHKDYEKVINIAHTIATGLAGVHGHLAQIYGPSVRMVGRMPGSVRALGEGGTREPGQFELLVRLAERPLLADSARLLRRATASLAEVLHRLAAKYAPRPAPQRPAPPKNNHPRPPDAVQPPPKPAPPPEL